MIAEACSKTAALLNRSNRFHTLFHLPKRFGSARQVMMQRFQKQPIVTALGAASRQRRAEHRNRRLPIQFRHCPLRLTCRPSESVGNP